MWQGTDGRTELIEEEDAKEYILEQYCSGNNWRESGVNEEECKSIFGEDFFDETA